MLGPTEPWTSSRTDSECGDSNRDLQWPGLNLYNKAQPIVKDVVCAALGPQPSRACVVAGSGCVL